MTKTIGTIISVGLIISALILGQFFYKAQHKSDVVKVVGFASMEYPSDILKWQVQLGVQVDQNNLNSGYMTLSKSVDSFKSILHESGLDTNNLKVRSPYSYATYSQSGSINGYSIEQSLVYTLQDTLQFKIIEELDFNPLAFYNKGIMLRSSNIEYYISELPQIKHNIIAEATKDAKIRAMKVADSSGGKVGKIISARVGVFQITEPLSTEVASYGIYSTSSKQKQISVTVSTEYELK